MDVSHVIPIGDHAIVVVRIGYNDYGPLGGNQSAVIEFDGIRYNVVRQGLIHIWAFAKRCLLTNKEAARFDFLMDQIVAHENAHAEILRNKGDTK